MICNSQWFVLAAAEPVREVDVFESVHGLESESFQGIGFEGARKRHRRI